jgi:hypothetical protein
MYWFNTRLEHAALSLMRASGTAVLHGLDQPISDVRDFHELCRWLCARFLSYLVAGGLPGSAFCLMLWCSSCFCGGCKALQGACRWWQVLCLFAVVCLILLQKKERKKGIRQKPRIKKWPQQGYGGTKHTILTDLIVIAWLVDAPYPIRSLAFVVALFAFLPVLFDVITLSRQQKLSPGRSPETQDLPYKTTSTPQSTPPQTSCTRTSLLKNIATLLNPNPSP